MCWIDAGLSIRYHSEQACYDSLLSYIAAGLNFVRPSRSQSRGNRLVICSLREIDAYMYF
jgi:hypothetical protein